MTARLLPREEWARLAHTTLGGTGIEKLDAKVVVVEDESGAIVGCWAAFPVTHVEGLWIAPAYRGKTSVARRLWAGMLALLRSHGTRAVWTGADSPEIHALLTRHGGLPVSMQSFVLNVGDRSVAK